MLRGKITRGKRETWTLPRNAFDVEAGRLFELERSVFGEAPPILRGLDMANRFNDVMLPLHKGAIELEVCRFIEEKNLRFDRDGSGRRRFDEQNGVDRFATAVETGERWGTPRKDSTGYF